jgi:hypothetical protein
MLLVLHCSVNGSFGNDVQPLELQERRFLSVQCVEITTLELAKDLLGLCTFLRLQFSVKGNFGHFHVPIGFRASKVAIFVGAVR